MWRASWTDFQDKERSHGADIGWDAVNVSQIQTSIVSRSWSIVLGKHYVFVLLFSI